MGRYSSSGLFGQVKLSPQFQKVDSPAFDCIEGAGWHKVNDLYRFDRKNGGRNHLLLFTVSGKGGAYIGEKSFSLESDSVLIIPPNIESGYYTPKGGEWEFYWIHLTGANASSVLGYLTDGDNFYYHMNLRDIRNQIELIINSKCSCFESPFFAARMISKILFRILYAVYVNKDRGNSGGIVADIIENMEENYLDPLNLTAISKNYYISEEHLIRIFKAQTGTTPYNYYRRHKLIKSSQLLIYTDASIKGIALCFGYSSLSAYSSQFKKVFGISPSEYREKNKVYQS